MDMVLSLSWHTTSMNKFPILESADEKTKSASEVSEKSDQLLKDNKEAIEQLKKDDEEARRLMKEGKMKWICQSGLRYYCYLDKRSPVRTPFSTHIPLRLV